MKSAKDSKKKGEKKKNLDRQALEAHRSKSRQRGEPEEESPSDEDDDDDEDSDDSKGMASRLDRILEGPPRGDVDAPRTETPKEGLSGSHRPRADIPPLPRLVRSHRALPRCPKRAVMLGPRRRGHFLAAAPQPPRKERPAAGVPVPAPARRELMCLGKRLPSRGL